MILVLARSVINHKWKSCIALQERKAQYHKAARRIIMLGEAGKRFEHFLSLGNPFPKESTCQNTG